MCNTYSLMDGIEAVLELPLVIVFKEVRRVSRAIAGVSMMRTSYKKTTYSPQTYFCSLGILPITLPPKNFVKAILTIGNLQE